MKWMIFGSILFILIGCGKTSDKFTRIQAYWVNNSIHQLTIYPYVGKIVPDTLIVSLGPGDSILIADEAAFGDLDIGAGIESKYVRNNDSMVVVFDSNFPISHYFQTPINKSAKYYLYESNRNLMQLQSYDAERKIDGYKTIVYKYHFTEQHYLDTQ